MTQAVEVALDATTKTREQERDREAWNLPQAPTHPGPAAGDTTPVEDGLEWQAFSAAHFPGRRRHDLQAIVAYGAYRRRRSENERLPG